MVKLSVNNYGVSFQICGPYYDILRHLVVSGRILGFFDESNLSQYIYDNLIITDDAISLKPYWPASICGCAGYNKHEFINFQYLTYELKQLYDEGKIQIDIDCNGIKYMPTMSRNKPRPKEMTVKMIIKKAKHEWMSNVWKRTVYGGKCDIHNHFPNNGQITICCVCNRRPIYLAKKVLTNIT